MNDDFGDLRGLVSDQTLAKLASVGRQGRRTVNSWGATNPNQVKEWEADGSLLQKAQQADNQALSAREKANRDGYSHLADHEVNELYGGPNPDLQ